MPDLQMLAELMAVATALSGYPAVSVSGIPPVHVLAPADFSREVCPESPRDCVGIVAHFDETGPWVRVSSQLDLDVALGRSFLVHELVHVLQYHHRGRIGDSGCQANLHSEQEAYRVQNAYLRRAGYPGQFGAMLANVTCAAQQPDDTHIQLRRISSG